MKPSRFEVGVARALWAIFGDTVITILFLSLLGALFGYLTSESEGEGTLRYVSVGAIFGAFLGAEFSAWRLIRLTGRRAIVGAAIGAAAGVAIGVLVAGSALKILVFALVLAALGAFGHPLLRHFNFP